MRYFVHWKFDPDVDEWFPKMLFEVDAKGFATPLNPGETEQKLFQMIHSGAWNIAQKLSQLNPDMNRLEEIDEDTARVMSMELRTAHAQKRTMGDIRQGDYIAINSGDEDDIDKTDMSAYGRVLEPLDDKHFLFLVLGVNPTVPWPFIHTVLHETDGKELKRKIEAAPELEPGKIYAIDVYGQIPEKAPFIRVIRDDRAPGWIHVPYEELNLKRGPGKPRRR